MTKVRHVLGISGGKDSAALAIYMKNKHPELDMEYYCCDTGKELDETYQLIENLESYLGKKILRLSGHNSSEETPFDHFYDKYGNYLPSSTARWCTKKLKLEPFERYIGNDPVISYVGIRGDEEREGYISKKTNIQSIFPFRENIWSQDVITKVLNNNNVAQLVAYYREFSTTDKYDALLPYLEQPISLSYSIQPKLHTLLDADIKTFNKVVYKFLQGTNYPLSNTDSFPLVDNDEKLIRSDIFEILEESGVGIPAYYKKIEYQLENKKGYYARSRSGCYFCFFQQKIEWVWLFEQHPNLFQKAMEYEKAGYSWIQDERLEELIHPERIKQIKTDHIKKTDRKVKNQTSPFLLDILDDVEGEGCAACFI